jgi:hypothetical protein
MDGGFTVYETFEEASRKIVKLGKQLELEVNELLTRMKNN